jgi:hypothetical protein
MLSIKEGHDRTFIFVKNCVSFNFCYDMDFVRTLFVNVE